MALDGINNKIEYASNTTAKTKVAVENKPVNSDNIFYSVCDMADITIDKKYSKPEWSVFARNLKPHERKLLVPDGKNYIIVK